MTRFMIVLSVACQLVTTPLRAADDTVKVFILAGQSNMEGKAPNALLDHQATDPKTKDLFAHLRKDDKWIIRDDVFIKFLDRKGPLTVGYGSPGRTGVELEFGTAMGNQAQLCDALLDWQAPKPIELFPPPDGSGNAELCGVPAGRQGSDEQPAGEIQARRVEGLTLPETLTGEPAGLQCIELAHLVLVVRDGGCGRDHLWCASRSHSTQVGKERLVVGIERAELLR